MRVLYMLELKKLFQTKLFIVMLCVLSAITVILAIGYSTLRNQYVCDIQAMSIDKNGNYFSDPLIGAYNLFNSWIGGIPGSNILTMLFYLILPLAAVLPYALSFSNERKSGYLRQMVLQNGKLHYYIVKYFAVFSSGFFLIFIPIVLNIIVTACIIPAYTPNIFYSMYYTQSYGQYLSRVFYMYPFLFLAIFTLLPSVFAGLWATVSLTISYFISNKYIILLVPYVFLFFSMSFFEMLLTYVNDINIETSPFYFLRGGYANLTPNIFLVIGIILFLFVTTMVVTCIRGKKDDVF